MPFPIRSKYYVWIVFVIFAFLSAFDIIPLLCGILAGYLHLFGIIEFTHNISNEKAEQLEKSWFFSAIREFGGFVTIQNAESFNFANGDYLPRYNRNNPTEILLNSSVPPSSQSREIFGGHGIKVSESAPIAPLSQPENKTQNQKKPVSRLVEMHEKTQEPETKNPANLVYFSISKKIVGFKYRR